MGDLQHQDGQSTPVASDTPREIPFTQYLLPNGRRAAVRLPVDEETFAKAAEIMATGFVFEIEMLRDGRVSATITHPEHGDAEIVLCANGPDVPAKIKTMIMRFKQRKGWRP